ncbi:MAG TPA: hypothetical protein IAB84_05855 [Candidatus Choladousia intestinigallinarum]|nr:hypothetical protein [Candidatus Choladousia intestinigallinarum]
MGIQNMGMVLLAAGIALCMFEYTLEFGATQAHMGSVKIFKLAGLLSLVQAALLLLSILFSILILQTDQPFWTNKILHGIITALLLYYALTVLKGAVKGDGFEERRQGEPQLREIFRQGLRAGGKTFAAGMAAWYLGRHNLWQPLSLWAVLFAAAAGGLMYGFWYGTRWRKQICFAEGILLLLMGLGVFVRR